MTATEPVENCTSHLNSALSTLQDSVAPLTTKRKENEKRKSAPWFTEKTCALQQACRRLKRKCCKSKLEVFYLTWHNSVLNYKRALSSAKTAYFSCLISNNKHNHNPRFLFGTVAKLTQKQPSVSCSPFLAHDLLDFFCNKIDKTQNYFLISSYCSISGRDVGQVLPFWAISAVAPCPPGSILFTFVLQSIFFSSKLYTLCFFHTASIACPLGLCK